MLAAAEEFRLPDKIIATMLTVNKVTFSPVKGREFS